MIDVLYTVILLLVINLLLLVFSCNSNKNDEKHKKV